MAEVSIEYALTDRGTVVRESVSTHCPYCALQCGMALSPLAEGGAEVRQRDFPTNRGGLCQHAPLRVR